MHTLPAHAGIILPLPGHKTSLWVCYAHELALSSEGPMNDRSHIETGRDYTQHTRTSGRAIRGTAGRLHLRLNGPMRALTGG